MAAAGLFAALFCVISPLNGFNMSEAEELVLRCWTAISTSSGLFIKRNSDPASLGAVMDVAMSILLRVLELRELNPALPRKAPLGHEYRQGRDGHWRKR